MYAAGDFELNFGSILKSGFVIATALVIMHQCNKIMFENSLAFKCYQPIFRWKSRREYSVSLDFKGR